MQQNVTDYFLNLIQIDSESKNERAMVDRLTADLTAMGATVTEDKAHLITGGNAGNLYAFIPGKIDKKPLLFCAHLDTVRPGVGIKPNLYNGKITSDGKTILGADDKSGIAEIIMGIKQIIASGADHAPIEILFTISEEIGLLGAKHFDKSQLKAEIGFAFDSEDLGEFMIGAPSQNSISIKVYGKEAHAGVEPEKGINALRVAAEALAAIPNGRIDFETTTNMGLISGGMATNIVPNLIEIHGEARSHNMDKLAKLTDEIVNTFKATAARHKLGNHEARVEFDINTEYKSFFMDESHPVVQLAKDAMAKIGIPATFVKSGGGSDVNIINAEGLQMIVAGTGMHGYHTVDENILVADLENGAKLVEELISIYSVIK
jgi:tripeptide aminopeptidase